MIHPCNRQTDGRTDGRAIAYTRYSIYAVARKKRKVEQGCYTLFRASLMDARYWFFSPSVRPPRTPRYWMSVTVRNTGNTRQLCHWSLKSKWSNHVTSRRLGVCGAQRLLFRCVFRVDCGLSFRMLTLVSLELHLTTSELWFGQEQEGILP